MNWVQKICNIKLPELSHGKHATPQDGLCAMEMIAYIERLPHSDAPECTCPVLAAFTRALNDRLSFDDRQKLLPVLPMLVGTVSPEHEQARAEHFAWAAIRVFAPMVLRCSGLDAEAKKLEKAEGSLATAAIAATAAQDAAIAAAVAADAALTGYTALAADYAAVAADAAVAGDAALAADYAAGAAVAAAYAADYAAADVAHAIAVIKEAIEMGPSSGWTKDYNAAAEELSGFQTDGKRRRSDDL